MRIRADQPGSEDVLVFLDGVKLEMCVEADDVKGWADVIDTDSPPEHPHADWPRKRLEGTVAFFRDMLRADDVPFILSEAK